MAIRKRAGRKSPYQVYWNNPITKMRESKSFESLSAAKKHDSLISHQISHERDIFIPDDEIESSALTFSQLFNLYLVEKKFNPDSLEATLYHVKPITKAFGKRVATSIEKKEVVTLYYDMIQAGVSASTSHRRISILRSVISWAEDKGLIEENRLIGLKLSKGVSKKNPPPSVTEAALIMKHAAAHIRRAVVLGMHFGMRIGPSELFSVKWDDIDFEQGIIRIWSARKNLNRPWRDMHVPDPVLDALMWWGQEDSERKPNSIIHWRGSQVDSIKTGWKKALLRAKISRPIRPYDLRHAFATIALQSSPDLKAVADIMGHGDATMILRTYQHVFGEKHAAVLDSMPSVLGTSSGHILEGFSGGFSCAQKGIIQ